MSFRRGGRLRSWRSNYAVIPDKRGEAARRSGILCVEFVSDWMRAGDRWNPGLATVFWPDPRPLQNPKPEQLTEAVG